MSRKTQLLGSKGKKSDGWQGSTNASRSGVVSEHPSARSLSSSKGRFFSVMGLRKPNADKSHRPSSPPKTHLASDRDTPAQQGPPPSVRRRASSLGLVLSSRPVLPIRTSSKSNLGDKNNRDFVETLVEHVEDAACEPTAPETPLASVSTRDTRSLTPPGGERASPETEAASQAKKGLALNVSIQGQAKSKLRLKTTASHAIGTEINADCLAVPDCNSNPTPAKDALLQPPSASDDKDVDGNPSPDFTGLVVEGQKSPTRPKLEPLPAHSELKKARSGTKPKAGSPVESQSPTQSTAEPLSAPKPQNKTPSPSRVPAPTPEHLARLGPLANFIPVSIPNPLHPPPRPPSPLPPSTTITLSKSPKNATKVKFGDTTIHTVPVHPGWHLKPIGPKQFKTRSGHSYLNAPADPLKKKQRVVVEFPLIGLGGGGKGTVGAVKARRHKERQAAMARYWLRTEEEEKVEREEMSRRAKRVVRRYAEEEGPGGDSGGSERRGLGPADGKGGEEKKAGGGHDEADIEALEGDDTVTGTLMNDVLWLTTYLKELSAFHIVVVDREPIMAVVADD